MGYTTNIFKIVRPQICDIKTYDSNVFKLDSKTKKYLLEFGLKDKIVRIAGKHYIKLEDIEDNTYCPRYDDQYYKDYWNEEIRNRSEISGWDVIVHKSRLEEICDKYISDKGLKDLFKRVIIDKHIDGQTIVVRF